MKKLIFTLVFVPLFIFESKAQLEIVNWKKICLEEQMSSAIYMNLQKDILAVNLPLGTGIIGLNTKTDEIAWTLKFKKQYTVGFGIYRYADNFMYTSNANTFDSKDKLIAASWIITVNPQNGKKVDSVKLNFDAMTLTDMVGISGNIALIRQSNDNKYSAVIIKKSTGEVKYELLKEEAKVAGNPNSIEVDPLEKYVAVGTANGKKGIFIYDFTTGKQLLNLTGEGDIHNMDFTSDSKYCIYIQKKKLNVLNMETLKLEKQISLSVDGIFASLHSDNENVAISGFGTKAPIVFMNWKTEKSVTSDLNTSGGKSIFDSNGNLYVSNSSGAVQCFVSKDKMPYLAKFTFKNSNSTIDIPVDNTEIISTPVLNTSTISQGSRAYIFYSADKKYYSGTITEVNSTGFGVVYDDGTKTSVKREEVRSLPDLKVNDNIQARRADKKFYVGTILEIKGQAAQIKFSATITEWIPLRDIMQVSDK